MKKLEKIDRVEPPKRRQSVVFEFQSPPRSGDDVATLKNVRKAYGSASFMRGSISASAARSAGAFWA